MPLVIDPKTGKRYNFGWAGPGKPNVKKIVEQYDRNKPNPAKEIQEQAYGSMAETVLPTAEFLGKDRFRGENKTWVDPFETIMGPAQDEDEINARSFDIPEDYKPVKGINEYIGESITPADIALSLVPGAKPGLKAARKVAGKAMRTSEVGAIGKDISQLVKAEKKTASSLLDNDLAGSRPRDIGTNPRAQKTNPRSQIEIDAAVKKVDAARKVDPVAARAAEKNREKLPHELIPDEELQALDRSRRKSRIDVDDTDFWKQDESPGDDKLFKEFDERVGKKPGGFLKESQEDAELRELLGDDGFEQAKQKWLVKKGSQPGQKGARKSAQQMASAHSGSKPPTMSSSGGTPPPSQPPGSTPPQIPPSSGTPPQGGQSGPPSSKSGRPKATLWQNLLGTPKSLKSMIDLPSLRQTVVPALTHPIDVGIPSIKAGAKSMFSDKAYGSVLDDISNRPYHDIYKEFGMAIPDTGLRQQFPATWAEEIPGIGRVVEKSEDAYDASLKTARANMADPLIDEAVQKYAPFQGPSQHGLKSPVPSSELQGISNYVNDFSGYGTLGKFERAADPLAAVMYSPRMLASRAQMLNPVNYLGGSRWGEVGANEARKSMGKFGAGTVGGLGALDAASDDVDVSWDPRSSDFASAQIGNTTFDTLGGLKSLMNLGARETTGESRSTKGSESVYDVGRKDPLINFARSKLAPGIPSMLADVTLGEGKDVVGQDIDREDLAGLPYADWAANQVTPMFPQGVYEAFDESGPVAGGLAAFPGVLGIGASSYDRSANVKKKKMAKMKKR